MSKETVLCEKHRAKIRAKTFHNYNRMKQTSVRGHALIRKEVNQTRGTFIA